MAQGAMHSDLSSYNTFGPAEIQRAKSDEKGQLHISVPMCLQTGSANPFPVIPPTVGKISANSISHEHALPTLQLQYTLPRKSTVFHPCPRWQPLAYTVVNTEKLSVAVSNQPRIMHAWPRNNVAQKVAATAWIRKIWSWSDHESSS